MKKTLLLLLAAATLVVPCTLTSCGGGGSSNSSFTMTAQEFQNGSKSFYINAMNLWTMRATSQAGNLILSGPDKYSGTVKCWGEITTGSYDKHDAGIAQVLFTYRFDAEENKGHLSWSWDSADPNNAPTAALAFIVTAHNLPGPVEDGEVNEGMGGTGEELGPLATAEHYQQMSMEFNFNTGMCVLRCGCGAPSQMIPFSLRMGS